jgi:L,D-transpeptidase ErfK/SrfK
MSRIILTAALAGVIASVDLSDPPIQASHRIAGTVIEYNVAPGETLGSIGARVGVDVATIASINHLRRESRLRVGQVLRVDSRHIVPAVDGVSVVINIPQRMLFLFQDGRFAQAFPVALGRRTWPTPIGSFSILTKEIDPTWDVPVSIQREMEREGKTPLAKVAPGPTTRSAIDGSV